MIIQAIDKHCDLFEIRELIDFHLIDKINVQELLSLPFTKETWQEQYNRRRLTENRLLLDIADVINDSLPALIAKTNMQITGCSTAFWLDGPGFTMTRHLDNSDVYASMQVYLTNCEQLPGTKFTNAETQERYTFKYQKNSGYLMINNINQYHEVAGTVPENAYRLCSYTWFLPKL